MSYSIEFIAEKIGAIRKGNFPTNIDWLLIKTLDYANEKDARIVPVAFPKHNRLKASGFQSPFN